MRNSARLGVGFAWANEQIPPPEASAFNQNKSGVISNNAAAWRLESDDTMTLIFSLTLMCRRKSTPLYFEYLFIRFEIATVVKQRTGKRSNKKHREEKKIKQEQNEQNRENITTSTTKTTSNSNPTTITSNTHNASTTTPSPSTRSGSSDKAASNNTKADGTLHAADGKVWSSRGSRLMGQTL